jgi:Thioredoxin like C-terminal domain
VPQHDELDVLLADVRPISRTNPSTWRKIKCSNRSDTPGSCPTSDHRWSATQARLLAPHNLGHAQSSGFASQTRARFNLAHHYAATPQLPLNYWDLTGTWTVAQHAALLNEPGGRVAFEFHARDLNLVMGPAPGNKPIPFRVFLDGQTADGAAGTDVAADGHGTVVDQRCYQLIRQRGPIAERRFEIEFLDAGVEAHCFTFG